MRLWFIVSLKPYQIRKLKISGHSSRSLSNLCHSSMVKSTETGDWSLWTTDHTVNRLNHRAIPGKNELKDVERTSESKSKGIRWWIVVKRQADWTPVVLHRGAVRTDCPNSYYNGDISGGLSHTRSYTFWFLVSMCSKHIKHVSQLRPSSHLGGKEQIHSTLILIETTWFSFIYNLYWISVLYLYWISLLYLW